MNFMNMSKNIVFEGWLTKSPPNKRLWRTKWRRRWFALRQSGELPGQYFLDYFTDCNSKRHRGTINLDLCEQVDAGLHMERGNGALAPKDRGPVFTIRTQTRIYHLEADCESDMEKWVDAICRVCGLRATEGSPNIEGSYQNNMNNEAINENPYDTPEGTGLYIPISECVTGARAQDKKKFVFDRAEIDMNTRATLERSVENCRNNQMYLSHPQMRMVNIDLSENESNLSDEDGSSLHGGESGIREWQVVKSFTRLTVDPRRAPTMGNHHVANTMSENGPPVPPRPPKTLSRDPYKEAFQGPKIQEPIEENACSFPWIKRGAPPSPLRHPGFYTRTTDDEEELSPGHQSLQYCNLGSLPVPLPPAVDRALKPRHSTHNPPHNPHQQTMAPRAHYSGQNQHRYNQNEDREPDVLQYLDLDLHSPSSSRRPRQLRRPPNNTLNNSLPDVEYECAYNTVDFVKTEAFNITRQDAEASRNTQH